MSLLLEAAHVGKAKRLLPTRYRKQANVQICPQIKLPMTRRWSSKLATSWPRSRRRSRGCSRLANIGREQTSIIPRHRCATRAGTGPRLSRAPGTGRTECPAVQPSRRGWAGGPRARVAPAQTRTDLHASTASGRRRRRAAPAPGCRHCRPAHA